MFARILSETFSIVSLRYICAKPSRVMMKQWKVDVITLLASACWLTAMVRKKLKVKSKVGKVNGNYQSNNADEIKITTKRKSRLTIIDSTSDKAKWLLGCDADAIKEVERSLDQVEKRCRLLITVLGLVAGEVKGIKPFLKVSGNRTRQ